MCSKILTRFCFMGQVFDSWGGELSKAHFEEFSLPYLARIAKEVKERVKQASATTEGLPERIPMTCFARNAHHALEALSATEYNVLSLDWYVAWLQLARPPAPRTHQK